MAIWKKKQDSYDYELELNDSELREEITRTKNTIDAARNHFEQVVDPTLIDCCI